MFEASGASSNTPFQQACRLTPLPPFLLSVAALIEYHCSKDPAVATRIFELGLKVFGEKLEFVDRYLAFLIMINDDQSKSFPLPFFGSLLRAGD